MFESMFTQLADVLYGSVLRFSCGWRGKSQAVKQAISFRRALRRLTKSRMARTRSTLMNPGHPGNPKNNFKIVELDLLLLRLTQCNRRL
jgi:hypothetical protein